MNYEKLDNEELLRLSLAAMNGARDADAVVMLKTLVERTPDHAYGQYLLAAQHAQMGLMDRAESGFRAAVQLAPEFPMARFQLGQLLLLKDERQEARETLAPLQSADDSALSAYASALIALGDEQLALAAEHLEAGLTKPQPIPALAEDMRKLRTSLDARMEQGSEPADAPAGASLFLSNYGRYN